MASVGELASFILIAAHTKHLSQTVEIPIQKAGGFPPRCSKGAEICTAKFSPRRAQFAKFRSEPDSRTERIFDDIADVK